jgi:hypothetical protein
VQQLERITAFRVHSISMKVMGGEVQHHTDPELVM